MNMVSCRTAVRKNRAHNIPTPRLIRRRAYLVNLMRFNSRTFRSRMDFAQRAAEFHRVDTVLRDRGITYPNPFS